MEITTRAELPTDPQTAFTMMTDKEYLDRVSAEGGATSYESSVEGTTTRSQRTLPAPGPAAKFVGEALNVTEVVTWGEAAADGSRTGELAVDVANTPASMKGTISLTPGGEGTIVAVDGNLKVNIPMLGKKLEQAAAPAFQQGVEVYSRVGREWLASH